MGSLIYGMLLGAVTGYYQMALSGLFVLVGIIGIVSGLLRDRITTFCFMIVFCVVWVVGIAANIMGIVKPSFMSTFDNEIAFGDIKIHPSYEWFLAGLLFVIVLCTPCLFVSICNCATIGNLIQYKKDKKKKKEKKSLKKSKMKPIIQNVKVKNTTLETELGSTNKRDIKNDTPPVKPIVPNDREADPSNRSNSESSVDDFSDNLDNVK